MYSRVTLSLTRHGWIGCTQTLRTRDSRAPGEFLTHSFVHHTPEYFFSILAHEPCCPLPAAPIGGAGYTARLVRDLGRAGAAWRVSLAGARCGAFATREKVKAEAREQARRRRVSDGPHPDRRTKQGSDP